MIENILTDEDILAVMNNPLVQNKKAAIEQEEEQECTSDRKNKKVCFSLGLPAGILQKLNKALGCDLPTTAEVPMTWIQGDTPAHADADRRGERYKSHLVYLTDNGGILNIGGQDYPIQKGCGFAFEAGVVHETQNTGDALKLLIGPFNALGQAVGVSTQVLTTLTTFPADILVPTFTSGTALYTANVSYSTRFITIGGSTNVGYYINFNGQYCLSSNVFNISNIPLSVGINTIYIALYPDEGGVCLDPLNPFYTLTITRQAPPPLYMGNMGSLFTDNALVYYKSHSLSSGGGGSGVKNSRAKQKRT